MLFVVRRVLFVGRCVLVVVCWLLCVVVVCCSLFVVWPLLLYVVWFIVCSLLVLLLSVFVGCVLRVGSCSSCIAR